MSEELRNKWDRAIRTAIWMLLVSASICLVMVGTVSMSGCSSKQAIAAAAQRVVDRSISSERRFAEIKEDAALIQPNDETEADALGRIDSNADAGVVEQKANASDAKRVGKKLSGVEDSFGLWDFVKWALVLACVAGVGFLLNKAKLLPYVGPAVAAIFGLIGKVIGSIAGGIGSLFRRKK